MITVEDIRQGLTCGQPGCACGQPRGHVHCPAHADDDPSLAVTEKDKKVLVKCFAGCGQGRVIAALKEKGLWTSNNGGGSQARRESLGEPVASYDYQDADGRLLFQVCRYLTSAGKTFRQRRPDGAGSWIWKMAGVHLVPYRLPQVLKADTVFVTEGEKDADSLAALGLTATTNPGGAGKWRTYFSKYFQGKKVVILPDADDVGGTHAEQVAKSLCGVAASVKVVELPGLPEKGDVSDWLDAGGTVEQLQALVEVAPEWDPATTPFPGAETTAISKSKGDEEPTQQEILLSIAAVAELFHTPDDEGFARVPVNGHLETWAIKGRGLKKWLLHKFFKLQGKGPQSEVLSSTLQILEAQALFDGIERRVWLRLAEHEGAIYLDLGNEKWEAVKITANGWEVVADPPVYFRRPKSMLSLPYPVRGGSVSELRPFVNVASDEDFLLMIAFLLAALRPRGPYPNTALNGEQGSAKSTTARGIRSLVDPNISPLRSAPREERDLMVAVTNSWMATFDNFSGIPPWLADALCRLATGGGNSYRQLYTDGEEHIMDAMRPVIMNGISSLTERSDLADRSLIFNLPQIPEDARRPEEEFWADFEEIRPRVLGALLDAVSMGLRNQGSVKLPALPRMADFAIWVVACEPALPWPPGSFMSAYMGNRAEAVELSLEADVVAVAVRAHMADKEEWSGKPSELYEALENYVAENTRKSKAWPKAAHWLTYRLKRAATFLRTEGVKIDFGKSGNRKTTITRQGRKNSVQSAQSAQAQENQGVSPDASKNSSVQPEESSAQNDNGGGILDAFLDGMDASQKVASSLKADNHEGLDGMDAMDASLHTLTGDMLEVEL